MAAYNGDKDPYADQEWAWLYNLLLGLGILLLMALLLLK